MLQFPVENVSHVLRGPVLQGTDGFSLADAIQMALEAHGTRALSDARLITGYALDFLDSDSVEARLLERYADERLLQPFVDVAAADGADLRLASFRAMAYLTDECMVESGAAQRVADGIAEGVARWKGVGWSSVDGKHVSYSHTNEQGRQQGRISPVVGLFIDARGRAHVSALRRIEPTGQIQLSTKEMELRDVQPNVAQLLGRGTDVRANAMVAASDLDEQRYLQLSRFLNSSGVKAVRWLLPTDALALASLYNETSADSLLVMVAHLGAHCATFALHERDDGILENLAVAREDVGTDLYGRSSSAGRHVDLVDSIPGGGVSALAPGRRRLRVMVVDELSHDSATTGAIRAALLDRGVDLACVEFVALGPDDVAEGLAVMGGMLSGAIGSALLLRSTWFSIALMGIAQRAEFVGRNSTVPITETLFFDHDYLYQRPDKGGYVARTGALTHLAFAVPGCGETSVALPNEAHAMTAQATGVVKLTLDIDPAYRLTLTLCEVDSGRQLICRLLDATGDGFRWRVEEIPGAVRGSGSKKAPNVSSTPQPKKASNQGTGHGRFWVHFGCMAAYIFACIVVLILIMNATDEWASTQGSGSEWWSILIRVCLIIAMCKSGLTLSKWLRGIK